MRIFTIIRLKIYKFLTIKKKKLSKYQEISLLLVHRVEKDSL